jgi:hypothetical protein
MTTKRLTELRDNGRKDTAREGRTARRKDTFHAPKGDYELWKPPVKKNGLR